MTQGYSYLGNVLNRIFHARGITYTEFTRQANARGFRAHETQDFRQNTMSNWMKGKVGAPRDLPGVVHEVCRLMGHRLSEKEFFELAVAFAYGQKVLAEDKTSESGGSSTGGVDVYTPGVEERLRSFEEMFERFLAEPGDLQGEKEISHSTTSTTSSAT